MKKVWLPLIIGCMAIPVSGNVIKGKIKDAQTGEEIIGAKISVKEDPTQAVISGLDGSFNLKIGKPCTLVCSYIGYQPFEITVDTDDEMVEIPLVCKVFELNDVTVTASNPGRTEAGARLIEKNALNVVNVLSARAIELSPDITVANVIQRMSGVTIERNSSGEGQYAILRGMDKRYNYILLSGKP